MLSGDHEAYIETLITPENITVQHKSAATAEAELEQAHRIMDKVNKKQPEAFYKNSH